MRPAGLQPLFPKSAECNAAGRTDLEVYVPAVQGVGFKFDEIPMMQLTLERCTIRPWRLNDADSLATHANNRKVWIALRDLFPHPYTIEDAHTFLKSVVNSEPVTLFCIEVNVAAVGGIGIRIGTDVHRQTAELGYWLSQEFWRRGIMTEAVGAFTEFCFEHFQLRRIFAEPFANNAASARVLEKAGFALEGRLKNNVLKDGKLLDSLLYAQTR